VLSAQNCRRVLIVLAAIPATINCGQQAGNQQRQTQAGLSAENRFYDNEIGYAGAVDRRNWRGANIFVCARDRQIREAGEAGSDWAGTRFRPYCACLVDRVMANVETARLESLEFGAREQAIAAQCAREHGLRPDPHQSLGGPFPDRM
jgi:hypothetical protein